MFDYQKPTDEQLNTMNALRQAAQVYASMLESLLPPGPDKTFCIRNHRTTAMWANVAVTKNPDGTARS